MMKGVYIKLAWTGIKKNKKIYFPYIVASIGMVMMCYIMNFLASTNFTENLQGIDTVREIFLWGAIVISIFAGIFLFYTNSFIMKTRKKELGLYNVLGMDKQNIGRIVLWENLFVVVISMVVGIIMGILFSKLSELFMLNLIKAPINYSFRISVAAIFNIIKVYGIIFLIIFLNNLRQIKFTNTIDLLQSKNAGEKPLKGNLFVGLLGAILLAIGYYIAVTIKDPYSAIVMFFIAVLFVIAGTYFVMIFSSVLLCKCLQRNKNYYYNKKHFISVSSMAYRMRRNGASLASICILLTMILVIISTTGSLYFGLEDVIDNRSPYEFNYEYRLSSVNEMKEDNIEKLQKNIDLAIADNDITVVESNRKRVIEFTGGMVENKIGFQNIATLKQFFVIPLKDYNNYMQEKETLSKNQVFVINICENNYDGKTISVGDNVQYQVKKVFGEEHSPVVTPMMMDGLVIVVPDIYSFSKEIENEAKITDASVQYIYNSSFNTDAYEKEQMEFYKYLNSSKFVNQSGGLYYSGFAESKVKMSKDIYGMYGGFLGLGVLMSILFTASAVLIIYYKQISEGFEDQSRFVLMQKIGMTKDEIRKSVNGQLIIVFLLPVILAGLHLIFAFPMLKLILNMMFLYNDRIFFYASVLCFIVCIIIYMIVYKITSKGYLRIVSGFKV